MIPAFGLSGLLPPFVGPAAPLAPGRAPYKATLENLVAHFGTSPERCRLLHGLLDYRAALRGAGIVGGMQWINGSFVEDCEARRARAPGDIDVVTFFHRPAAFASQAEWIKHVLANPAAFQGLLPDSAKATFGCHGFLVELDASPSDLVAWTHYWFGLFSHERTTQEWKGLVEVPFTADLIDEALAAAALSRVAPP